MDMTEDEWNVIITIQQVAEVRLQPRLWVHRRVNLEMDLVQPAGQVQRETPPETPTSEAALESKGQAITNYGYIDYTGVKDAEGVEADHIATDRVSALMLKLLVVLNTRQTLVEYGTCVRPQRFKHGRVKQRELWSPNLIGWHYRPAQAVEAQGTHAKPRLHWRRGHVRNQPHGPGRTQRRLIWIEPMLVGIGHPTDTGQHGPSVVMNRA